MGKGQDVMAFIRSEVRITYRKGASGADSEWPTSMGRTPVARRNERNMITTHTSSAAPRTRHTG